MDPQTHFLFPFVIGLLLAREGVFSLELALLCAVIGVLVDLDHYIEHIMLAKENRFSIKAAWNQSERFHRFQQRSFIHHLSGAVTLAIVFYFISFYNAKLAMAMAVGYYSHLVLDYVHLKKEKFFRYKIYGFYLKEPWSELALDGVLVFVSALLLFF